VAVNRDSLKTIGGLAVIAVIIVGAFLYGNAQHQNQVRQDQNAKQQASQSNSPESDAGNVGQAPAKPSAQATPNPLQASAASTSPSPAVQAGKGGVTQTPQTGATDELIPLAFLAAGWVLYRRSLPKRAAKRA
jgi:cytoskeletal protein RodZ